MLVQRASGLLEKVSEIACLAKAARDTEHMKCFEEDLVKLQTSFAEMVPWFTLHTLSGSAGSTESCKI